MTSSVSINAQKCLLFKWQSPQSLCKVQKVDSICFTRTCKTVDCPLSQTVFPEENNVLSPSWLFLSGLCCSLYYVSWLPPLLRHMATRGRSLTININMCCVWKLYKRCGRSYRDVTHWFVEYYFDALSLAFLPMLSWLFETRRDHI